MTQLSNYAESALLNHILGITAMTMPADVYLQLHVGNAGEDCTANVAATSTRVIITTWAAASAGAIANSSAVQHIAAGTETISHFSVWDALTSGNPLFYGALTASRAVTSGDALTFPSGDIDASFPLTALTTFGANSLLEHLCGRTSYTSPADVYVALHTGAPGTAGTANPATETDRTIVAWAAVSGGATSNSAAITWTAVAATETITHISIRDAASAGNALFHGALAASKGLTAGGDAEFAIGELEVALT